jgi:transposase
MSLKIEPPRPMPAVTAAVGRALLKENSPYRLIGEQIYGEFSDEAFADLFSIEGQPAISPTILAFVTIFQFMEKLSDRQAAESLRMRIDWKYALHLPLDYAGFDYSVLSEFRDRLVQHQAEKRVFEQLLQQFSQLGLIKRRGRQRTDSLAVLSKVRWLSRLELVVESLRLAVGALLKADRDWIQALLPPSWEDRYGERFTLERVSEKERQDYETHVGADGQWLLTRLEGEDVPAELRNLPEVQVLRTVWAQQFRAEQDPMVFAEKLNGDGHSRISTPHDPQARYSKKRGYEWIGGKVQVTETDDDGYPHLITDLEASRSTQSDAKALPAIQGRLAQRDCLPEKQYVDNAYLGGPNLAQSAKQGIDLIGPIYQNHTPQDKLPHGVSIQQFEIDLEQGLATCPEGVQVTPQSRSPGRIRFLFPQAGCAACRRRPDCCLGEKGRSLQVSEHYPLLQAARQRQKTEAFQKDYHRHRSGVEGCISALVRATGLRQSRYIGDRKRQLQAQFSGSAVNLKQAARWLAGERPKRYRRPWGLAPTAAE